MRLPFIASDLLLVAASHASPFDGTWKIDPASVKLPNRPDVQLLKGGTYSCTSCVPKVRVPADGQVHPVAGAKTFDAISVTVTDPNTVTYSYQLKGQPVSTTTESVSADHGTLTTKWHSTATKSGEALDGSSTSKRVGALPAGAHPVSGTWQAGAVDMSDNASTMTLAVAGKSVTLSYPTGESFTAQSGGPFVPLQGDPLGEMDAVVIKGPRVLELRTQRGGELANVSTLTVAADGRTLTGSSYNPKLKTTTTYTATKQ